MELLTAYSGSETESDEYLPKTLVTETKTEANAAAKNCAMPVVNDFFGLAESSDEDSSATEQVNRHVRPLVPKQVAADLADLDLLVNSYKASSYQYGPDNFTSATSASKPTEMSTRKRKLFENPVKTKYTKDNSVACRVIEHVSASKLEEESFTEVKLEINPVIDARLNTPYICRLPKFKLKSLQSHTECVNKIVWGAKQYSHLLLSASLDKHVKIWDVFSGKCVFTRNSHKSSLWCADWILGGKWIVTGGYDKFARLIDVEHGKEVSSSLHPGLVSCVRHHPFDDHLFIVGSLGVLSLCDTRNEGVVRRFESDSGQVLDCAFIRSGNEIVCSNDIVMRDSADRTIMAWDVATGAVLSNQIYQERYTCPSLAVHPTDGYFVAQSNGNYIAQFSSTRPYKMNRRKRYEGHKVQGYRVGCDFSFNGKYLYSGSSDGDIYCYNSQTSALVKCLNTGMKEASVSIASHPVLDSTIAVSFWDGAIHIWQ